MTPRLLISVSLHHHQNVHLFLPDQLAAEMAEHQRRSKSSPEFEFWMVPDLEPHGLHTADELFVDGVLLPLHLLSISSSSSTPPGSSSVIPDRQRPLPPDLGPELEEEPSSEGGGEEEGRPTAPTPPPESSICSSAASPAAASSSNRWKDIIFKKRDASVVAVDEKEIRRRGRHGRGNGGAAPELNINIWPFSRSGSAGDAAPGRPKPAASCKKSSSAPCSRSNSGGGSGRWRAASPGRSGGGVHVGRGSPVRRGAGPARGSAGLNLNVDGCIGCRNSSQSPTASCRGEEEGGRVGGSSFKFRALFSKRVVRQKHRSTPWVTDAVDI